MADALRDKLQTAAQTELDQVNTEDDRALTETLEQRKLDIQEAGQEQQAEAAAAAPTEGTE
jgi:DNA replicative helicase MCM subunit Mcm2 (Cdc46/Mcm family)